MHAVARRNVQRLSCPCSLFAGGRGASKYKILLNYIKAFLNIFWNKKIMSMIFSCSLIINDIPARKVSLETTKKCLQNQLRFNTKITILLFQNNLLIMKHQRISKRDGDILMLQHFFDFSQFFVVFLMFFIFSTKLMFSNWFLLFLEFRNLTFCVLFFASKMYYFHLNVKISTNKNKYSRQQNSSNWITFWWFFSSIKITILCRLERSSWSKGIVWFIQV